MPGHVALNLATPDVEAAAVELTGLGYQVRVWDETYGKQGVVVARDGRVIGLNENHQDDLYGGYRVHDASAPPELDVVAVCVTPDLRAEAAYFAPFGFTAPSYDDPWWIGLRASDRSGVIGLTPVRSRRGTRVRTTIRSSPCTRSGSASRPPNRWIGWAIGCEPPASRRP